MKVIKARFRVKISLSTVLRILKKDLGWSPQKPITVLRERDEAKIANWRSDEFERIKWQAKQRGAYLAFADEAGFMLLPTLRKTFAPRGSRPAIRVSEPHGRISTACAITVSPKRRSLNLFFHLLPDNTNFTGNSISRFLEHIRRKIRAPLTIIWDSIPIHSAEPVRMFLRHHHDVVLEMIPQYAPELNPADGVWSYVKYGRLANYVPLDLAALRRRVKRELAALKRKPELLLSFIRKSQLAIDL
jgi:transposase